MYISLWENSRGHPDNVSFMQFSTKIDGFEQTDSQRFENSYNSYEQYGEYPLEKFLFHHLPKLYFGFNVDFFRFHLYPKFYIQTILWKITLMSKFSSVVLTYHRLKTRRALYNAVQICSIENQKGTIAFDFVQQ